MARSCDVSHHYTIRKSDRSRSLGPNHPMCPEPLKKFGRIDTMLITHGHFDHIAEAVALAKRHKSQVVGIFETCAWLESKGVRNTHGMNKGGTQRVGEIEATMVHAIHSCGIQDGKKSLTAEKRAAT